MKHKRRILVAVCALALLCGCSAESTKNAKEESSQETSVKSNPSALGKGDSLPLPVFFEGQDTEGNEVTSEIFSESRLTMINVWATYCSPCLNEMPDLGELADEYAREDFQLIGVVSDVLEEDDQEKIDLVTGLIGKTGADYPHLLLNESLSNGLLEDVTAVPTTFFLNEKGTILDTVVGAMDKDSWKQTIDEFLDNME